MSFKYKNEWWSSFSILCCLWINKKMNTTLRIQEEMKKTKSFCTVDYPGSTRIYCQDYTFYLYVYGRDFQNETILKASQLELKHVFNDAQGIGVDSGFYDYLLLLEPSLKRNFSFICFYLTGSPFLLVRRLESTGRGQLYANWITNHTA